MMLGRRHFLGATVLAPFAISASGSVSSALAAAQPRIVSVGGAMTETVYALGAGADLVGVDSTSLYPPAARAVAQIGYMRALPPEGIVSLTPDLVLLSSEAGPPAALDVLRAAGLRVVQIPDGPGVTAAAEKIRAIGAALNRPADALADAVAADWHLMDAPVAALTHKQRVLFILSASQGAPLASGIGTHANSLITAAGGVNVLQDFNGYRPLSAEAAAALRPDAVVMMDYALQAAGGAAKVAELPILALTPAGAQKRILGIDSTDLAFGPRAAQARHRLLSLLYPAQTWPSLPARPWASA